MSASNRARALAAMAATVFEGAGGTVDDEGVVGGAGENAVDSPTRYDYGVNKSQVRGFGRETLPARSDTPDVDDCTDSHLGPHLSGSPVSCP